MREILANLKNGIANKQVILFVGAGVSMSLDLPSYADLIRDIGSKLDYDGDIFHDLGDYLTLAEYYHIKKKGYKELQEYLRNKWNIPDEQLKQSEVHKAIIELDCQRIYTTNFDGLIERSYRLHNKKYKTIRSVKDLVGLPHDTTHIVKLHGDLVAPSGLVFTESSYFERLSFEAPLDIKLRSDALGKSLLFIGYSLSDINIRYLFYKLQKQWETETDWSLRPKSYVYMSKPNEVQEEVLFSRGIHPIVSESDLPTPALINFLKSIKP